jgi:phage terminase large subunit
VWPKSQDGKELKEAPVKADDHGMDATRYMVAYLDIGRSPGVFL